LSPLKVGDTAWLDLSPLKVGDTAWFHTGYSTDLGIEKYTIRKVDAYVDDSGITKFVYYIKDKYQRYMNTWKLDPPEEDTKSLSPYFIFSTPEKCMDFCVARFKNKVENTLKNFEKSSKEIGYTKQLLLN